VQRRDTAKALLSLLDSLEELLLQLNLGKFNDKVKNYYLTYNATVYLYDLTRALRRSVFGLRSVRYLAQAIVALEGNIILLSVKYLEWRINLYAELSSCYQENDCLTAAVRTLEAATVEV
jgi:hypothetical protein